MYTLVKRDGYQSKNRLQKAIYELLESQDRRTFKNEEEMKNHKAEKIQAVADLCQKHPRCNKIELSGWNHVSSRLDESLSVYGLIVTN